MSEFRTHMMYDNTGVTVELGELVKSGFKLWDFEYPSWYKGEEKAAFEQLVIDHYRFRQIGQETPARFKHYFITRVREIMPYYIQLYESAKLLADQEDPLKSYDLTEEIEQDTTGKSSGSSNSGTQTRTTNQSKSETMGFDDHERRYSDTPQGSLDNLDNYLTQAETTANNNSSESTSSGSTTNNTSTDAINVSDSSGKMRQKLRRYGNIGVQPLGQEINALRSAFINIDMQIIDDLNCLFLGVY